MTCDVYSIKEECLKESILIGMKFYLFVLHPRELTHGGKFQDVINSYQCVEI